MRREEKLEPTGLWVLSWKAEVRAGGIEQEAAGHAGPETGPFLIGSLLAALYDGAG